MSKLKGEWAKKSPWEKIFFVAGMVCAVSVIGLALLQIFDLWENSAYVYQPLMAALLLSQAYENRKRSRSLTIFSLIAAAFILLCWVLIVFFL